MGAVKGFGVTRAFRQAYIGKLRAAFPRAGKICVVFNDRDVDPVDHCGAGQADEARGDYSPSPGYFECVRRRRGVSAGARRYWREPRHHKRSGDSDQSRHNPSAGQSTLLTRLCTMRSYSARGLLARSHRKSASLTNPGALFSNVVIEHRLSAVIGLVQAISEHCKKVTYSQFCKSPLS